MQRLAETKVDSVDDYIDFPEWAKEFFCENTDFSDSENDFSPQSLNIPTKNNQMCRRIGTSHQKGQSPLCRQPFHFEGVEALCEDPTLEEFKKAKNESQTVDVLNIREKLDDYFGSGKIYISDQDSKKAEIILKDRYLAYESLNADGNCTKGFPTNQVMDIFKQDEGGIDSIPKIENSKECELMMTFSQETCGSEKMIVSSQESLNSEKMITSSQASCCSQNVISTQDTEEMEIFSKEKICRYSVNEPHNIDKDCNQEGFPRSQVMAIYKRDENGIFSIAKQENFKKNEPMMTFSQEGCDSLKMILSSQESSNCDKMIISSQDSCCSQNMIISNQESSESERIITSVEENFDHAEISNARKRQCLDAHISDQDISSKTVDNNEENLKHWIDNSKQTANKYKCFDLQEESKVKLIENVTDAVSDYLQRKICKQCIERKAISKKLNIRKRELLLLKREKAIQIREKLLSVREADLLKREKVLKALE